MTEDAIKNISAVRVNVGSIAVSWTWPAGCPCVRIVMLHRLGGKDIGRLSEQELASASDLCFPDEFQVAGGKYIYPVGENDKGLLKFQVFCCDDPSHTDLGRHSAAAHITGITLNIRYKTTVKKSGKAFKKVIFSAESDCDVPAEVLAYKVDGRVYPASCGLCAGTSQLPPVVVPAQSDAVLCLAAGHEEEFALAAQ